MFVEHKSPGEVSIPSRENLLDDASKLLLRAADFLDEPGKWGQGGEGDELVRGDHCVFTAINECSDVTSDLNFKASQRFRDAIGVSIFAWNDTPGRTQAEVVAKLRSVALGG